MRNEVEPTKPNVFVEPASNRHLSASVLRQFVSKNSFHDTYNITNLTEMRRYHGV